MRGQALNRHLATKKRTEEDSLESNIETRRISINVSATDETSGLLSLPARGHKGTAVILAHGAANDMTHPLLATFAEGLARAGYPVLRFNFLYADHGRKAPDRESLLVATWAAAYRFLKEGSGLRVDEVAAAGKSMGGRIASQMAAHGQLLISRLILLGYPLHRMGDSSILHDSHLYNITIPMLFIEGTRDTLCDVDALREVLSRLKAPHDLFTIEGGDHSFHVPKSTGLTEAEIYTRIVKKALEWLSVPIPPEG